MGTFVAHLEPYPLGDSLEAPSIAASRGAAAIDGNIRTCRANTWSLNRRRRIVVVHSAKWWEHGFEPKPGKRVPRKPIEQLTLRQVRRLRSKVGHHEIPTAEEFLIACDEAGVIALLEMKPSTWTAAALIALRDFAERRRIGFAVMTVRTYGKTAAIRRAWERAALERLTLAHSLDIPTCLQWRAAGRIPLSRWTPVLTGVKNRPGWRGVLGVRQLVRQLQRAYT